MWWIASVAIVSSIFVISFMIGYAAILHWRRHKGELALLHNNNYIKSDQKYILKPSTYHKREPTSGIPYSSSEPMNIQPHPKTLQFMDCSMLTDENINNSTFHAKMEYQIPLVSYYESGEESRKYRRRRSLKDSYGPTSSRTIETPTIIVSQVPDHNANLAQNSPKISHVKPELTFSIFYDAPSKDLHVTVISAANLPVAKRSKETRSTQYFRVRVHVCSMQRHETRYVCGTREPVFSETFIVSGLVHHRLRECTVRFVVVEFEEFQSCWTVVGEVSQPLIDFRANKLLKATKILHQT